MAYYADTSALAKLVIPESESAPFRAWLLRVGSPVASSDLSRTELLRAVRRTHPAKTAEARAVLDTLTLLTLPTAIFDAAGLLSPSDLRALDAIHLAAALSLGDELEGLVTYDARLATAATENGIEVVAPA